MAYKEASGCRLGAASRRKAHRGRPESMFNACSRAGPFCYSDARLGFNVAPPSMLLMRAMGTRN